MRDLDLDLDSVTAKGAAPLPRRHPEAGAKVLAQYGGRPEPHQFGDAFHCVGAGLQQRLAAAQALRHQPLPEGETGGKLEAAAKGASAHHAMFRQAIQGVGRGQVQAQVIEQLVDPGIPGGGGHRLLDELGLATLPVGRHTTSRLASLLAIWLP